MREQAPRPRYRPLDPSALARDGYLPLWPGDRPGNRTALPGAPGAPPPDRGRPGAAAGEARRRGTAC